MKKYYLHNTKEKIGPFDKEELKAQKINKETLIKTNEMEEWKKAEEIDELKAVLLTIPPPQKKDNNKKKITKTTYLKYLLIATGIIILIVIMKKVL